MARSPSTLSSNIEELAREVSTRLAAEYPGSARDLCALDHDGAFQLLVATILSAQCTDERVNSVTPALFARYGSPELMAAASRSDLEELIKSTGFFRNKAASLLGMSQALLNNFAGEVPHPIEQLVRLPGVGRKTANVVRSVAFSEPGLPVDTHVGRLSRRIGLVSDHDPVKVEHRLTAVLPPDGTGAFSLRMILHGRAVCRARAPRCADCCLADICQSAELPEGHEPSSRPSAKAGPRSAEAAQR